MTGGGEVYVAALNVGEIFADPTYQRPLDEPRVRVMVKTWDRKLLGILEVSDRGEHAWPRYAVVDGMHRWAAAARLPEPPPLVANVHTGLTVAEEAVLFDKLNRLRKKVGIFDHYRARLAAGEPIIVAVQRIIAKHGLTIDSAPRDGCVGCVGALEKIADIDDALLDETLGLVLDIWGKRREGLDGPIIHGLALVLHHLRDKVGVAPRDQIDVKRLVDALLDVHPRHLKNQAVTLRDTTQGTLPVLTALCMVGLYNKKPGRKLPVTPHSFGGVGRGANIVKKPNQER